MSSLCNAERHYNYGSWLGPQTYQQWFPTSSVSCTFFSICLIAVDPD